MITTHASLLLRIRNRSDAEAWKEFHALYAPLLYRYARGRGLAREDAEEVRDQCLEVVSRKIADFDYDKQKGGFKNWLYRIASGKVVDHLRKRREKQADTQALEGLVDPSPTPDDHWEQTWKNEHLKYCVEQVRSHVSEMNYRAFHMLLFEDCTVDEVRARLGMNANQVYKAKSRVLLRVRKIWAEVDPDSEP